MTTAKTKHAGNEPHTRLETSQNIEKKQQKTKENNIHESWVTFLKTVQAPSFKMLHLLEVTYCAKCFELQMFGRSQLKRTHYITDANQMVIFGQY